MTISTTDKFSIMHFYLVNLSADGELNALCIFVSTLNMNVAIDNTVDPLDVSKVQGVVSSLNRRAKLRSFMQYSSGVHYRTISWYHSR